MMQAVVKNEDDKMNLEKLIDQTSQLTSDNIIFPDDNIERPFVRYGYSVSSLNFLVPESLVSEVIQEPNIFNLPNSPFWIEGLMNIRGNIVPVMNIDKLLKKYKKDKSFNILVLSEESNKPMIAIMINDLPVSLELTEEKTTPLKHPDEINNFIRSGFKQNDFDWFEFSPHKLFRQLSNKEDNI